MYKARTGGGRKSVSGERYDPTEDDLDVTAKVVPKSDEQRKRLQESTSKIMLLNRLDEVNFRMVHHSSFLSKYIFLGTTSPCVGRYGRKECIRR